MAKKGMARPDRAHVQPRNEVPPVPQIQGKAKHGKQHARPMIEGTSGPDQKVFHDSQHSPAIRLESMPRNS